MYKHKKRNNTRNIQKYPELPLDLDLEKLNNFYNLEETLSY